MQAENVLEFEPLRELVGRYVRSALGRAELEQVAPSSDRAAIESALADAGEAITYLRAASGPQAAARGAAVRVRFDEAADPGTSVARLRIEGATLEAQEIAELARLLDLAAEARSVLIGARERFPRLAVHAGAIADLRELVNELRGKILPDGTLADHTSVALARLRRDIEKQRHLIEESLQRFLRAHHEDGTLQEDFVTIRNDRFVVPVVTGRERRVEGVIHGASGSGHTLFVEPLQTIDLNNELVRLREEELREIHRILREFTAKLRRYAPEIAATAATIGRLDLIFAKAEFALEFNCVVPRISEPLTDIDPRRMVLDRARHPLLEDIFRAQRKTVVPISFTLEGDQHTLLISGPNTGGKTVALKTAGLLALMAHAGFPVPALDAEFPLFDQVLTDIGDHQSIQESLSTFSAHILAIRRMLEHATPDSLILIDELGRATDPEEGGALGVVVLDAFRRLGTFTVASTHLMALKIYGASTPGVRNGSMGFDDETLAPTYVLRLGAPGKSAGLDIASRLGLDPALIEDARARMTSSDRDVARFLAELHEGLDAIEKERRELSARERSVTERERSLEQTWERKYSGQLAAKVRELEQRGADLASQFERKVQDTMGELSQKARAQAQAKMAKTRREYQEGVEAAVESVTPGAASSRPSQPKLEPGARIRLKGIRQPATVRRMLSSGLLEVEAGFLKMQVALSDVDEILPPTDAPATRPNVSFRQGPSFGGSYSEINVVGQRAEEACAQVDKLLDSAALAQVERVRIIHGHGMGILKRAIGELLKENPHVQKFYAGTPEDGGTGATIVELKV